MAGLGGQHRCGPARQHLDARAPDAGQPPCARSPRSCRRRQPFTARCCSALAPARGHVEASGKERARRRASRTFPCEVLHCVAAGQQPAVQRRAEQDGHGRQRGRQQPGGQPAAGHGRRHAPWRQHRCGEMGHAAMAHVNSPLAPALAARRLVPCCACCRRRRDGVHRLAAAGRAPRGPRRPRARRLVSRQGRHQQRAGAHRGARLSARP